MILAESSENMQRFKPPHRSSSIEPNTDSSNQAVQKMQDINQAVLGVIDFEP